ncbi:nudix hydrolase 14 [Amylocarpus encephaloides]|uniref:Nudix hydrolase 14 n=1 Tax=Amylocarpus encephaloides TaxID=45428 RepID=A0A9P7YDR6_9HELO|nr:nudix hydrolase 14 [Amylocarpus encephaloides]
MTTFYLKAFAPEVPVLIPSHLQSAITEEKLLAWPHFTKWHTTLKSSIALQSDASHAFHKSPYYLKSVEILSVSMFGPRIGFVKLKANVVNINDENDTLPGIAFLRGSAVAMLMILRPSDSRDERWVIMTEQPRIPAGSLSFLEIPAGMMDEHGEVKGQAVAEIQEETRLVVPKHELINLTELAIAGASSKGGKEETHNVIKENLAMGMYPSPGGSDEFIHILLWEKELDRQEIEDLRGKFTGLRTQQEKIVVRLLNYEELWQIGARDAKTLAAWSLYEALKRDGEIKVEW